MLAVRVGPEEPRALQADVPVPVPRENEALIRVLRAGICNTDLEICKGYAGFQGTLGHEFVGEVAKLIPGPGSGLTPSRPAVAVGDRVVGEINLACHNCHNCHLGGVARRNHCSDRTVLGIVGKDGTFAEYITLPTENLYRVPDNVSTASAAFAEPLAAAFRIAEQVKLESYESVAVIGDGKLGLLITEVVNTRLRGLSKRVVIFGRHADKMALAPDDVERVVLKDVSSEKRYENAFDVTIEASGTPSGVMTAAVLTQPLGTVILKTTCAAGSTDFSTAPFVVKEITIIGSRCGNFDMALAALDEGHIKVDKYITRVYPFTEAEEAISHAARKGTLKIQLVMGRGDE